MNGGHIQKGFKKHNNMSYTKGNWEVIEISCQEQHLKVAEIPYIDDVSKANGKLIAAAPVLLEACKNALRDIQKINKELIEEGKHGYILMENELNDVINKAT